MNDDDHVDAWDQFWSSRLLVAIAMICGTAVFIALLFSPSCSVRIENWESDKTTTTEVQR